MPGEVVVGLTALQREWRRRGEEALWVLLQTKAEAGAAWTAASEAMVAANDAELDATGDEPRIGGSGVSLTARGPVIFIGFCDEAEALGSWLGRVARELTERGLSGKLTPIRSDPAPIDHVQSEAMTTAFTVPIDWEQFNHHLATRRGAATGWYVDPEATGALIDTLVPWCLFDAQLYLAHGGAQFAIDAGEARDLVAMALRAGPRVQLVCCTEAGDFQRVVFDLAGQVTLARRRTADWHRETSDLERVLVRLAPLVEQGLIRRSLVISGAWSMAVDNHPLRLPFRDEGLGASAFRRHLRHLLASRTLDAYGIQILNDQHLARATDLSGWDVREVSPGRHLVRARTLDAWFDAPHPDPATLARARADFGELIATPQNCAEPAGA